MKIPMKVYRCKVCGRIDEAEPKSYIHGWHWAENKDEKCHGEWEQGELVFKLKQKAVLNEHV